MFSAFYRTFKSSANIYSVDRYKDSRDRDSWLIVTAKEIYTLKGDESG